MFFVTVYCFSAFFLATINILASDDGHGVISFNTSKHLLLKEPTSAVGLGESVARLYVVRNPEEGTFGTVSVQFTVTDVNGSLAEGDLTPTQGFVVLEDGVRFKVREIDFFYYLYDLNLRYSCVVLVKWHNNFELLYYGFIIYFVSSVLLKMLEIWAVLDAEPEANETFTVTLSSPTGGARLGLPLQSLITVLENLAPSGLFLIRPTLNRF